MGTNEDALVNGPWDSDLTFVSSSISFLAMTPFALLCLEKRELLNYGDIS